MSRRKMALMAMVFPAWLVMGGCHKAVLAPTLLADRIFTAGTIVTMNEAQPVAEAIAIRGAEIIAVGSDPAAAR